MARIELKFECGAPEGICPYLAVLGNPPCCFDRNNGLCHFLVGVRSWGPSVEKQLEDIYNFLEAKEKAKL